ncbi:MAG: ABC transporter ATP-binding protein [Spirochaetales bacterium]|nr:ABC transporter ATP-binding protein [Spirochaetales bacterium]
MLKEFKTLIPYLKRYIPYYIAGLLFLIITDAAQLLIPQFIRKAINLIYTGNFELREILTTMALMLLIALFVAIGRFGWRYFIHGASRRIERELRDDLFSHLLLLSSTFYRKMKTGDIMARATNDMRAIRMASGMGFVAFIDGIFMMIAILIILFTRYPQIALITIAPLPVVTLFVLSFGKMLGHRFKRVQEGFSRLSEHAQESLSGIRVIKTFVQEKSNLSRFEETNEEYRATNMALVRVWGFFFPIIGFLSGITSLLLLKFGGVATLKGDISPGDFVAVLSYLEMLIWPMMGAGFMVNMLQRGAASLERINKILHEKPDITSPPEPLREIKSWDIRIDNLSFSYNGEDVLDNISFLLPEGNTLGILGRTGSGKSTLIRLLPRLLDPPKGSIFLGGQDVHEYELSLLRSAVGLVPQDTFLFSSSIRENLSFGNPDMKEEGIREVADISTISRELETFSEGWNTQVGERGISLSGGQKQRISISRALAIQPPVMIFDDALSAVDTETEESILNAFLKKRQGKTNIIISHRVSTLHAADSIIVLDEGKIIQRGTHEELVREEGLYQEINNLQKLEHHGERGQK